MRKNNKKGFTIVELVIVIAVIAILAAVLIPTFSGMVSKANMSKVQQEAQNAYKEAYAEVIADGKIQTVTKAENGEETVTAGEETKTVGEYTFKFTGSIDNITSCTVTETGKANTDDYTVTVTNGTVSVAKKTN